MRFKNLFIAAIPLFSLGFASLGEATIRDLYAALGASGVPNGDFVFDCNHVMAGQRAQIESHVTPVDRCGDQVGGPGQPFDVYTNTAGVTVQGGEFQDDDVFGPCGVITQHQAVVFSYLHTTSSGTFKWNDSSPGLSGCWDTNFNTGACIGHASAVISSSTTPSGTCTNHTYDAYSFGSLPCNSNADCTQGMVCTSGECMAP